jgi:hypothetical protein
VSLRRAPRSRPERPGRSARAERGNDRPTARPPARGTSSASARPDDGLAQSLASTLDGLAAFAASLERSGMPEALCDYTDLAEVLVHQRGHVLRQGRRDLDPLFEEIGRTARACEALLGGYAGAFGRIASAGTDQPDQGPLADAAATADGPTADESGPDRSAAPAAPPPTGRPLVALLLAEGPIGPRRAARRLGRPESELAPLWSDLVAAGLVECRGRGGGMSYRLAPAVAASLADALAAGPKR